MWELEPVEMKHLPIGTALVLISKINGAEWDQQSGTQR